MEPLPKKLKLFILQVKLRLWVLWSKLMKIIIFLLRVPQRLFRLTVAIFKIIIMRWCNSKLLRVEEC